MHPHFPTPRKALLNTTLALAVAMLAACGGGGGDTASPASSNSAVAGSTASKPISGDLPTCAAVVDSAAPLRDITAIQGTGALSPLLAQTVTVRGVVVGEFQNQLAPRLNGFFIQQAEADRDPVTSEGLFVFAPNAGKVAAGDFVQVSGTVSEFPAAPATGPAPTDSVTQLSGAVTVSLCGSGVRVKPTKVRLPVDDATELERYEGMLVEFSQELAVTELFELGRFGQLVLSLKDRQFHPNNGNEEVTAVQNRLARIVLDDGSTASNPNPTPYLSAPDTTGTRRMGDTLKKLTGVLSHNFGAYRVHPTETPEFKVENPRPSAAPDVRGDLKVASFNVLNYFTTLGQRGANTTEELTRQRAKIVEAIAGLDADVLGLMEIENSDVATRDLVTALNAKQGAGTYAAVNSGSFGTDQIKVDILYKPSKVKRVGGVVLPTGADLATYTAASGRPPLAQRFASVANNGGFWFVVNHFKSKGSCPNSGDIDAGQGCWNLARTAQSAALNNFVGTLKAQGESDVLMMGDFNSYLREDPVKALQTAGFESLLERMKARDRFTYVFGGETGALDHAYASGSMSAQVRGVDVWHINADEPTVIDYNTENKTNDRYAPTPFRASDHDPVLVGLNLKADAEVNLPILSVAIAATAQAGQAYQLNIVEALPGGSAMLTSLSVDWGDGSPATAAAGAGPVAHTFAAAGSFTVTVTLANSAGQIVSQSGTVSVSAAPSATGDLFFSEYVEGSSNNKAIEIYNPTAAPIDLANYTVRLYANGATTPTNTQVLAGTLAPRAVRVLVNASAAAAFQVAGSVTSAVVNFNGDDALTLEKSGVVIDRFGQLGVDPGTAWTSGAVTTANLTLRRKPGVKLGDNNAAGAFDPALQWDAYAIDTADGLGAHTVTP